MPVVQIEKPANQPFAAWFSGLRQWLDLNRCEAQGFTPAGRRVDRLVYLVSFKDPVSAREFSLNFREYDPVIRRPTLSERSRMAAEAAD